MVSLAGGTAGLALRAPFGGARALTPRVVALRGAAAALSWLYLYSGLWLTAYAVIAALAFGWNPVVITGGSMQPGIAPGDVVMVAAVESPVERGTVLTFRAPGTGQLVTHRVTQVLDDGYRTRGDANRTEDSDPVVSTAVLGAGRLLVPLIGRPFAWLREGALLPLTAWVVLSVAAVAVVTRRPEPETSAVLAGPDPVEQPVPVRAAQKSWPALDVLPTWSPRRRLLGVAYG